MLHWLDIENDAEPFPSLDYALEEPNGLLAAGGTLSPQRLLNAYRCGIFPWFEEDQPILWWSPDPRLVLKPNDLHISRSLKKCINKNLYSCTVDKAFNEVIVACSTSRKEQQGTWITDSMIDAYQTLFTLGHAHSVEVWADEKLVGGLYGVSIGQVFFGESMFSRLDNASKVGFAFLCKQLSQWEFQLIDCQVHSDHLERLGASTIPRKEFAEQLAVYCLKKPSTNAWLLS
ncbi:MULTISPECIES: leucyl/phenylalanyl-tRNA--protein transferase [Cycloclasticus]|uniref:Leucyl/phenylalanyl-tRNA--protein transferase n=1 Tax=Cycloclasticus pugetii TaxID=34068 RepID=A0AB33YZW8_9GAMM|nr:MULTISPECIES: leucyl/phenylalanyl-tRNA--protein transferase [Cycloclasticus]ATI03192.1 leucyl/phenylalanyl-tRNA--protein transferase [Cycloclasticus sp. PY97N]EPD12629.1 leucyl/phenylalanyl-tRNA--protein transferase [Cycloclasticus pugetii]